MLHFESSALETSLALLVDRDADTRSMYAEYLRHAQCEIEEAADGREALAKAIARRPNVIITETLLPGISGLELCALLRGDSVTQSIPIIVVTGAAYPADLARARQAGADSVLVKPCLPETLMLEINRVLETSALLRARANGARLRAHEQLARSAELRERSARHHITLAKAHSRGQTTTPPLPPPQLICPHCDAPLVYQSSQIGGVSVRHSEQWDYYTCQAGCGTFQYRHRTRKLRRA